MDCTGTTVVCIICDTSKRSLYSFLLFPSLQAQNMVNFIDALAEYIRIVGQVVPEIAEYPIIYKKKKKTRGLFLIILDIMKWHSRIEQNGQNW